MKKITALQVLFVAIAFHSPVHAEDFKSKFKEFSEQSASEQQRCEKFRTIFAQLQNEKRESDYFQFIQSNGFYPEATAKALTLALSHPGQKVDASDYSKLQFYCELLSVYKSLNNKLANPAARKAAHKFVELNLEKPNILLGVMLSIELMKQEIEADTNKSEFITEIQALKEQYQAVKKKVMDKLSASKRVQDLEFFPEEISDTEGLRIRALKLFKKL